jgi:hypothetical protein
MGTGMTTIVDDSDPAIIYSNGWTQIGTLTSQSTEYNATCHRADQNGLTAQYTFYGKSCSRLDAVTVYIANVNPFPFVYDFLDFR